MTESVDLESLQDELAYYKRHVDELAGENLRLDYTISGLRHELKQKRQGFALLSELQQSIGAHKQISSIFDITIGAINATLGMDKTVVLSPAERENCYRPSHWLGFREDATETLATLSLEFPSEFSQGTGLLVVNKSKPSTPAIDAVRTAFDLPYFICLPVMGEESESIGLLLTGRLKEVKPLYPPLDEGDVDTMQAIAGLISASVRNLRIAVLEEMDRMKTEFFANISHEFRTPITLTLGPLEQLLTSRYGDFPEPARHQLQIMQRNQERLLGLIDQILDLAKLEAGGMKLKAAPLPDINRWIEERVLPFRSIAESRGLELRLALDPHIRVDDLYVDREKLDKILANLLSNALKFTRQGYVEVSTDRIGGAFRLGVSDTGIGIKEDQLPYVFDRFRQADGSESREFAGTGIGLALVREFARLHGGEVTVHSQPGKGTSFRLSIPLGKEHLSPSSVVDLGEEAPPGVSGPREIVMIRDAATGDAGAEQANEEAEAAFDPERPTLVYSEDNPDMREHVRDILAVHYNVFVAVDGRDGLEKIRKYRPDLVVSDGMMPHLSGRELLREIRRDPEMVSTPVIFLTARAGTEARIESLDAGADDYLAKPFHEGELLARIRNLLRARMQEKSLAELNRRLEARVEEQMGELLRSGELRRFLPRAVAESLLSGQIAAAEHFERRKVTILFADLVGFTDLADELEPEELSHCLNEFLQEMSAIAVAHGGTVEKFIGDEVMVVYGAPQQLAPAAQAEAAVRTALQMRERTKDLATLWRRRGVPGTPKVRIGINTGFCTVGVFGSDLLRSYMAVGTPTNVASRLRAEANAGGIMCSFATYALVQDQVRADEYGALQLRGVARPVEAYEIHGLADPV